MSYGFARTSSNSRSSLVCNNGIWQLATSGISAEDGRLVGEGGEDRRQFSKAVRLGQHAVEITIIGGAVFGGIPLIDDVTRALRGDAEPLLGHGQRVAGALAVYRDRNLVGDKGQDIPVLFGVAIASMVYLDSHDSDCAPLQLQRDTEPADGSRSRGSDASRLDRLCLVEFAHK